MTQLRVVSVVLSHVLSSVVTVASLLAVARYFRKLCPLVPATRVFGESGAVHVTEMNPFPAVAVALPGCAGGPGAIAVDIPLTWSIVPAVPLDVTVNLYDVPPTRPVTGQLSTPPPTLQGVPAVAPLVASYACTV
jgi:hypothetical protein